ncbi:MAG: hypothetical protein WC742_00485 [Gallionellaceae bacterium]
MISNELFEKINEKYGDVASWAVWEDEGAKPKSNMGHSNIFDLQKNPSLLATLKNNVVMVGLNFSRPLLPTEPFKNFHDLNPSANDFKIRYAFRNTEFYGAYMTDVIKNLEMKDSHDVQFHLKNNPELIQENISLFCEELSDIEAKEPIILAFGVDTYNLLNKHLKRNEYSKLIRLTHYSQQIGKEDYKKAVFAQINGAINFSPTIAGVLIDAHDLIKAQVERIKKEHDRISQIKNNTDEIAAINDLRSIAKELVELIQKRESHNENE